MTNAGGLDVRKTRLLVGGLVLIAAATFGVLALLDDGSAGNSSDHSEATLEAVALSESELLARATSFTEPVFWVGPRPGTDAYELSSTSDGVYVRYLTDDAEAGDPRRDFITIGTYPVADAKEALRSAQGGDAGAAVARHDGYEVLASPGANSVYAAFDDEPELQVEIYAPRPGEAERLVTSGALQPIE